jgi:HD-GYP domain-containing protein (c-di-GMP phosphodiesterase class II)
MNGKEKESAKEAAAREQFVVSQFERAGLDIREYQEIFERFKILNGPESRHFEDAAQMVDIIEAIWDQLEKQLPELEKEKMILATLLHDIGKSGPKEATPEEQGLIVALFDPRHYRAIAAAGTRVEEMSIFSALRKSDIEEGVQQKIVKYLSGMGVNIATEKMIDFWRRHADWTYDILKASKDDKLNERLAAMAASHHILDGKNPAGLNPEDIPNESKAIETIETYEVLTLVDKFQAFVKRSGLSHDAAIRVLEKIIEKQKFPERVKEDYRKILRVIEISGEKISAKMK